MSWAELLEEYESERIGPQILDLVRRAAGHVCHRYDPRTYGSSERWDEDSIEDLVQEFVLSFLLGEGQLEYLISAGNLDDFNGLLEFQLRRCLSRRRTRSVVDNLLDRCRLLLTKAPFNSRTEGRQIQYWHSGRAVERRAPEENELRAAVIAVLPVPRLIGEPLVRAPMVYTTENLALLLEAVAKSLPSEFALRDLDAIFRQVLTPFLPSPLTSAGGVSEQVPDLGPEDALLAKTAAERIVEKLETEQALLLGLKLANVADGDIARQLGVSRPTISKRKQEVESILLSELAEVSERVAEATLENLALRLVQLP